MSKDALQELEVKVAFLEDALNKLSDEHYQQQKELEKLRNYCISLSDKVNSGGDEGGQDFQQEEIPPHY